MNASIQYFDRAAWALHNAMNDDLPLNVKSHLTAAAVHACQSLKESLDQAAELDPDDTELAEAIKNLPHTKLIENVRHMDLHGSPIPICDPQVQMVALQAKPDHPIKLSPSHGVRVTMQMAGLTPKIHRSPKDLKHGKVSIGPATVSYGCDKGRLFVHDFSTGKDHFLLDVLRSFLEHCHPLLKDRMPSTGTAEEEAAGPDGAEAE